MKKILFLIPFILFGCKKKDDTVSNVPVISFISVNPSLVQSYKDSLTFTISYDDNDGDIGENNAATENLFLNDNRINITYKYRIKQLSPSAIHIKGNLDIVLKSTDITDSSASQTATYSIYLIDRAGNKSNTITSNSVTIIK